MKWLFKSREPLCFSLSLILPAKSVASGDSGGRAPLDFPEEGRHILQLRIGKEVSRAHDIQHSNAETRYFSVTVKIGNFYGIEAKVSKYSLQVSLGLRWFVLST